MYANSKQALSVLDAFNKDRASMPQPLQAPPPLAPLPFPPDARTQEMIKEKLQKAEELGKLCNIFVIFINGNLRINSVCSLRYCLYR